MQQKRITLNKWNTKNLFNFDQENTEHYEAAAANSADCIGKSRVPSTELQRPSFCVDMWPTHVTDFSLRLQQTFSLWTSRNADIEETSADKRELEKFREMRRCSRNHRDQHVSLQFLLRIDGCCADASTHTQRRQQVRNSDGGGRGGGGDRVIFFLCMCACVWLKILQFSFHASLQTFWTICCFFSSFPLIFLPTPSLLSSFPVTLKGTSCVGTSRFPFSLCVVIGWFLSASNLHCKLLKISTKKKNYQSRSFVLW